MLKKYIYSVFYEIKKKYESEKAVSVISSTSVLLNVWSLS